MKNYCQFVNCNKEAVKKGTVYSKDISKKDSELEEHIVYACEKHSKHSSFFPDVNN